MRSTSPTGGRSDHQCVPRRRRPPWRSPATQGAAGRLPTRTRSPALVDVALARSPGSEGSPLTSVLVYGLGVAGAATVRALQRRGVDVVVLDDAVDDRRRALAAELDVELTGSPD